LKFSRKIFEKPQMPNFKKLRPMGVLLFHADRRTDIMKLKVTFRNFAKVSISYFNISVSSIWTEMT